MHGFDSVVVGLKDRFSSASLDRVQQAYDFAKTRSRNLSSAVATAEILLALHPDEETLVVALLHGVDLENKIVLIDIERNFGARVIPLLKSLAKLAAIRINGVPDTAADNLRKLFLTMAKDIRVVMIKLAQRLHRMRTLAALPQSEQQVIAHETLSIYVPIAGRLGMYHMKGDLEDLAFQYVYPVQYTQVSTELSRYGKEREKYIAYAKEQLIAVLKKEGIVPTMVEGRVKHLYSIYRKMVEKGRDSIADIFDIFAVRIILPVEMRDGCESVGNCYTTLGVIHNHWTPLPKRFKDYIAVPKVNRYRSLHTAVLGLGSEFRNQPTEIQIRTVAMHNEAEFGVAAHWWYKESERQSTRVVGNDSQVQQQIDWLKRIATLHDELKNTNEFWQALDIDMFRDRIFVLTPTGDVKDLPVGATPVDFAYAIHTELGNHCAHAKVNGRIVALNTELKNGDVVEIITKKNVEPSRYWLSFVRTSFARARIKAWFKALDRAANMKAGRDLLNAELVKFGKPVLDPSASILRSFGRKRGTLGDREDLLVQVGSGLVTVGTVLKQIFSQAELLPQATPEPSSKKALQVQFQPTDRSRILVTGEPNLPITLAACCNPTNRDRIVGHVTRGNTITIHCAGCGALKGLEKERIVEASWSARSDVTYQAMLRVEARNRKELIRDISSVIVYMGISIMAFDVVVYSAEQVVYTVTVQVAGYDELATIIDRIGGVPDVLSVTTVR